jgi:hypothetical protein
MAKIKLDEEDVALIMSEFMLERPEAEKALRQVRPTDHAPSPPRAQSYRAALVSEPGDVQNGGDAKACIVATLES